MESAIELRDLSAELLSQLDERAKQRGMDRQSYVVRLIKRDLSGSATSIDEILAPVREDFNATGMTEEELTAFIEEELAAARRERRERADPK
jgi:hypothetical protein